MTYKLESVAKDLAEAISAVKIDALKEAKDDLFQDSGGLARTLFEGDYDISTAIAGIDWSVQEGDPPLSLYILDLLGDEAIVHRTDPIGDLIEGHKNFNGEVVRLLPEDLASLYRAIDALQSGIDRLRAHEAECLKAQL